MKKQTILISGVMGVLLGTLGVVYSTSFISSNGKGDFNAGATRPEVLTPSPEGGTPVPSEKPGESPSATLVSQHQPASSSSGLQDSPPTDPPEVLVYPSRTRLYRSSDSGTTWESLDPLSEINTSTYLTAAAVNPRNSRHIIIGTSFEGFYESTDDGKTWSLLNDRGGLNTFYQGAGFYNEAAAILFHPETPNTLLIREGYSNTWYEYSMDRAAITWMGTSQDLSSRVPAIQGGYLRPLDLPRDASSPRSRRLLPLYPQNWPIPPAANQEAAQTKQLDEDFWRRREQASDKRGIYLNPWQAENNLEEHLDFVEDHGMNSIIVDFKDDQGNLTYDSQLEIIDEVDSQWIRFDVEELIQKAHERGIYVIARVVVFKDKQLYRYKNHSYALWDHTKNAPWGVWRQETPAASEENPEPESKWVQIEYWVDPYADFVHQYNIAIARELQELGVDEIQFDYIRFPSDGLTRNIRSRYYEQRDSQSRPQGYEEQQAAGLVVHPELLARAGWPEPGAASEDDIPHRVEALSSFLRKAREALTIPIGTDVFGFNAWARMGYLGQDIEAISFYVDVISPMAYPSHYARDFLPEQTYFERAETLYDEGTIRARTITGDRALIRPYIQAFLIGGELRYEYPEYTEYLNLQIRGTINGGGSGFSLWNNSGRYYMVDKETYLKAAEQDNGSRSTEQEQNSQQAADSPDSRMGG
ncbi:putative glycoside hydrolase [Spirochaeta lutea]|uniref:putative glycoside hydrolase n=1 Tax=Spirochaeta lutea TaxID=1480694 RepID=UPI000AC04B46|nr:putative glycoside hydrolase [Spirochaeta lutea]